VIRCAPSTTEDSGTYTCCGITQSNIGGLQLCLFGTLRLGLGALDQQRNVRAKDHPRPRLARRGQYLARTPRCSLLHGPTARCSLPLWPESDPVGEKEEKREEKQRSKGSRVTRIAQDP
jgi:hypothetical protein